MAERTIRPGLLWVVVAVVFGLLGLAVFSPRRPPAQESMSRSKCRANLWEIGDALRGHAMERGGGAYPAGFELLFERPVSTEWFACRSAEGHERITWGPTTREAIERFRSEPRHCSYVYVGAGLTVGHPAEYVVAYEPLANHGGEGTNLLFNDGRAIWLEKAEAARVIAELEAGHNPPRPTEAPSAR